MTRFLYDTAVFVYARGPDHPYRDPCRRLVELAGRGVLRGEASVELVSEYAHVVRRRGLAPDAVATEARQVSALCRRLHPVEVADLSMALRLLASHPRLGVRDAVHAATALRRDIPLIVSTDRDLDDLAGIERVDPKDAVTRLMPS